MNQAHELRRLSQQQWSDWVDLLFRSTKLSILVAKGESLPDTIRTLECYTDVIVLRHPETGSAASR